MSRLELMVEPKAVEVRRIEVISGTGRRRRFSDEDKARILEETFAPGAVVSHIARHHELSPQQLFTWRRAARRRFDSPADECPDFVPAVVETPEQHSPVDATPLIGFDLNGASVWVCPGADAGMVTAIIRALKASK